LALRLLASFRLVVVARLAVCLGVCLGACVSPRSEQDVAGDAGDDAPAAPHLPDAGPGAERPGLAEGDGPIGAADRAGGASDAAPALPIAWSRAITPASATAGATRAVAVSGDQIYATGWFADRLDFGGMTAIAPTGGALGFLVNYDASGALHWLKTFECDPRGGGMTLAVGPAGDVAFSGTAKIGASLDARSLGGPFVAWISGEGRLEAVQYEDGAGPLAFDARGDLIVAGTSHGSGLLAFAPDHQQVLWQSADLAAPGVAPVALALDPSGDVYLCGELRQAVTITGKTHSPVGGSDVALVRSDPGGAVQWATTFGSVGADGCEALALDRQGDVYVAGTDGGDLLIAGQVKRSSGGAFVARFTGDFGVLSWIDTFEDDKTQSAHAMLDSIAATVLVATLDLDGVTRLRWLSPATGIMTSALPVGRDLQIYAMTRHSSGDLIFGGLATDDCAFLDGCPTVDRRGGSGDHAHDDVQIVEGAHLIPVLPTWPCHRRLWRTRSSGSIFTPARS
jgi:hypothetical protein